MALRAIMLRKKIDDKKKALEAVRTTLSELETREAEIEKAISEAETDEERAAVDQTIDEHEAAKAEADQAAADLNAEIEELEGQLAEEERAQNTDPVPEPATREEQNKMQTAEKRNRFGITNEMVTREDVSAFLGTIRECVKERRALSNAGLLIPDVFLGLVRENLPAYSKLYKHVFVRRLGGEGKVVVMGTIPEAIWTACCANINEIDLSFADVTVDCNKVAAIIPVCNAILEDSDIDLAGEIVEALSISIGIALDKAILYGSGSGQPLGIYTRLAQTSEPAGYPATGRAWVDLHSTNMLTIANSVTGTALFQTIMLDSVAMSGKYSRGEIVWAMNETTLKFLRAQGMNVNAAGAIVSAVDGSMPGVGGAVEILDFIPNYNIVGGYFDNYLLGERRGVTIESSQLPRFVDDETIFRGKARYDGQPVIAEAFLALALNSASLSPASLAEDTANTAAFIQLNKNAATLATTTGTLQLKARLLNAAGQEVKGAVTWASSDTTKATVDETGKVTGKASGSAVITATSGDAVAVCNVTVPS